MANAEEILEKQHALRASGIDLEKIALRVSELMGLKPEDVWGWGKYQRIVDARSLFCFWAVRELGMTMASLGRNLGLSMPAINKSVTRGK